MVLFEDSGTIANATSNVVEKSQAKEWSANRKGATFDAAMDRRVKKVHIKLDLLAMFSEQLSSMLKAGLPLSHALDTIVAEIKNKDFHYILMQIKESIFAGESFSSSLKRYPYAFPPLFYNMVEAGEVSGSLPDAMNTVAEYLNASLKLTKKFKSALTYPIVVDLEQLFHG